MDPLPVSYYVTAFAVGGLLTVGVIIALVVVIRRTPVRLVCVAVGLLTFAVAQLFTRLPLVSVVGLTSGGWIAAHPWIWLVVLALTAGLFEETARALGFRLLLRREPDRLATPVGAGLGHGGLEAVVLVGLSVLATAATFLVYQSPQAPGSVPAALVAQRDALVALGPIGQLAALYERFPTIVLHVALSVLVFTAVRRRLRLLLVLAIVLHAVVDLVAAVAARLVGARTAGQVWTTELVLTAVITVVVITIWSVVRRTTLDSTTSPPSGPDR